MKNRPKIIGKRRRPNPVNEKKVILSTYIVFVLKAIVFRINSDPYSLLTLSDSSLRDILILIQHISKTTGIRILKPSVDKPKEETIMSILADLYSLHDKLAGNPIALYRVSEDSLELISNNIYKLAILFNLKVHTPPQANDEEFTNFLLKNANKSAFTSDQTVITRPVGLRTGVLLNPRRTRLKRKRVKK